ncbi:MAG: hypothetical protein ABI904_18490 [Chloroflexota bacterium]
MDITVILQVAIGIIFVWVILASITSQIQEWAASIFRWRANMLEDAIAQMLGDPDLKNKVYSHPLIKGLFTNQGKRKPAGIPQDKFALVLFDAVLNSGASAAEVKSTFENLKKNVEALKNKGESEDLKKFATAMDTLLIGIEEKADDTAQAITEARLRVESWFNNSMERLTGSYRRRIQIVGIVVGIVVSAAFNVDSLAIINALWKDPVVRQAVVLQADKLPAPDTQSTQTPSIEDIAKNVTQLNVLSLPVGWSSKNIPTNAGGWAGKFFGILLSGMAAAQGAPYWFDLMRKLISRNPPVPAQPS